MESTKILIALAAFAAVATAAPGYVAPAVVSYAHHLGVPLSYHGGVLDTPEVAQAKAAHLATQAYEAARNTLGYSFIPAASHIYTPAFTLGAPLGSDGRVVDTPEVAQAKAAHFAAHAREIVKSVGYPYGALAYASTPVYTYGYAHSSAPLDSDGRVVDTPEVAQAKAAHLAAHTQQAAKVTDH